MSHFTVTVVVDGTVQRDKIEEAVAAALAPYDENREVPRYVEYTKAELIANSRASVERMANENYAKFQADPAAYVATCSNVDHLVYLAGGTERAQATPAVAARIAELQSKSPRSSVSPPTGCDPMPYEESFPAKLEWSDEQHHASAIEWYSPQDIGADGEVYSTRNPKSQWDWYSIGGRWAHYWKLAAGASITDDSVVPDLTYAAWTHRTRMSEADSAYVREREARAVTHADVARKFAIDFTDLDPTYAFVTSSGDWHEKGRMGWFGMSFDEVPQEDWNTQYAALVADEAENAWFVLVDCHI